MKTSIFVLSAPRNTDSPWEYLQQTIAEIEKQSPNCYCAIVHDGPYAGPAFPGWDMLAHPHLDGAGPAPSAARGEALKQRAVPAGHEVQPHRDRSDRAVPQPPDLPAVRGG